MMNQLLYFQGRKASQIACRLQTSQNLLRPCCGYNVTSLISRKYFHSNFGVTGFPSSVLRLYGRNLFKVLSQQIRCNSYLRKRESEQVTLYTNSNVQFLRWLNIFGYSFGFFWLFTSYQYSTMNITERDHRPIVHLPWLAKFDIVNSYTAKILLIVGTGLVGCLTLLGAWAFSLRSVGKVILEKGGKQATFYTFSPLTFKMSNAVTANINDISCQGNRMTNSVVPIKIKGNRMHYLLMKEGSYQNGSLFDKTVGLNRYL